MIHILGFSWRLRDQCQAFRMRAIRSSVIFNFCFFLKKTGIYDYT